MFAHHPRAAFLITSFLSLFLVCCSGGNGGGGGGAGNGGIVTPSIQTLSVPSGPVGASITITGGNFGTTQGGSTVTFNGTPVITVESWSTMNITVLVPTGATTGNVVVTIPEVTNQGMQEQVASNGMMFTVTPGIAPSITSLNPTSGPAGTTVTITGTNFGPNLSTNIILFNESGNPAPVASWSATSIVIRVPAGATTGDLTVAITVGTSFVTSNGILFTVTPTPPAPSISSLSPTSGPVGTPVTITGANFGATQGNTSTVAFNGIAATVSSWSATSIVVTVPSTATTGKVIATVGGMGSNGVVFTVTIGSTCPLPTLGNESKFNGTYAGIANGWFDPVSGVQGPYEAAAAWDANGSGSILAGESDAGVVAAGTGVTQTAPKNMTFTGCYNLGTDLRGLMVWNISGGGTAIFAIGVSANGTSGRLIEFDDSNPSANPGTRSAGYFQMEDPVTATNAPVAFNFLGYSPNSVDSDYLRSATIGVIGNIVFGGAAANGTADVAFTNSGSAVQSNIDNQSFTATFTSYDSLGRGSATISFANFTGLCGAPPCPLTQHFAYYLGNSGRLFLESTDVPDNGGHSLSNGEAIPQSSSTFNSASLSRAVFQVTGADLTSIHAYTDTAAGLILNNSGAVTVYLDENRGGCCVATGTNAITSGSISIAANGMGSITFGPSAAYGNANAPFSVVMYGPNAGFILEGTQALEPNINITSILLGDFAPQTVPTGGFVDGSFSGFSIFGTNRPALTSATDVIGSLSTAAPQTSPASFSGLSGSASGPGCSTGCLAANQTVSATYAVDANGRFPITLTSSGGIGSSAIGWLRDDDAGLADKAAVILSIDIPGPGTVLKAIP